VAVGLEGQMDGQQPLMRLHEGEGGSAEARTRRAWTYVAEGYERALTVVGLSDEDRACLVRQLRYADVLARRAPLALAPSS
jgi:hypothetical protein